MPRSFSCAQTKTHLCYITATCASVRTHPLKRKLRCKEKVTRFDELLPSGEIRSVIDHSDGQINFISPLTHPFETPRESRTSCKCVNGENRVCCRTHIASQMLFLLLKTHYNRKSEMTPATAMSIFFYLAPEHNARQTITQI